eukprot:3455408-Rhodomonas_salina.8
MANRHVPAILADIRCMQHRCFLCNFPRYLSVDTRYLSSIARYLSIAERYLGTSSRYLAPYNASVPDMAQQQHRMVRQISTGDARAAVNGNRLCATSVPDMP